MFGYGYPFLIYNNLPQQLSMLMKGEEIVANSKHARSLFIKYYMGSNVADLKFLTQVMHKFILRI